MTPRHRKKIDDRPSGEKAAATSSPALRMVFWILAISFPFFVLLLLEVGLRLADYGGNLDLVVRRDAAGREYNCINRAVAQHYFPRSGNFVPEPRDEIFQLRKGPHTRRVFCLGESTMAGFPYDFHATAPSFLSDRLQNLLPEDTVEVINVGLSAVGSYVILDFVRELLEYEPDLFVVYLGHNEFYGAYGVGSSIAAMGGPWLTRLTLGLLKFKTFLLARNLYASLFAPAVPPSSQDATLMEQVVGQGVIPYGSSAYNQAREVYRENLERIIAAARSRSVPIMFTALVSNLRTHPPFRPVFADGTPMEARAQHAALMRSADSLMATGDARGAFERSSRAVRLDSTHAGGWFSQGTAAYALGRYDTADREFRRAKDLDALRFRATEDFQGVLFSVCAKHGVPVIRADSAFGAASPHGILGSELMTEHLHPNIRGYFLVGKVMAEAIRSAGLLSPPDRWRNGRDLTDKEYFARSTVSDFDSLCGAIRVELLMQHWPFPSRGAEAGYKPATPEAAIAYAYVLNTRAWSLARYDMASQYERQRRFDLARRECLAVAKAAPHSYKPLLRAADYYRMEGNAADAERYYRLSFQAENNPFARMKLAVVLLEGERSQEAAEQLVETLDLERRAGARLDSQSTATARYLLAVALAKTRQFDSARENLEVVLQLDPGNASARDLQRQIDAYQKQMQSRQSTAEQQH